MKNMYLSAFNRSEILENLKNVSVTSNMPVHENIVSTPNNSESGFCYTGQFLNDISNPINQRVLSVKTDNLVENVNLPNCTYFKAGINAQEIQGLIVSDINLPNAKTVDIVCHNYRLMPEKIQTPNVEHFSISCSQYPQSGEYGLIDANWPNCKTASIKHVWKVNLTNLSSCTGLSVEMCNFAYQFPFSCPNNTLNLPSCSFNNFYVPMNIDYSRDFTLKHLIVPLWTRDQVITWISGSCELYSSTEEECEELCRATYNNGKNTIIASIVKDTSHEYDSYMWKFTDI